MRIGIFPRMGARAAVVAVAVLTAVFVPSAAKAESHVDENLGYSVVYPSKWNPQATSGDSPWLAARFHCNREYEWSDAKTNMWTRHRPWMEVVVIPFDKEAGTAAKGGVTVEKKDDTIRVQKTIPYKDFKEYLDQTCKGIGGFHFSAETETTVGGLKCIQYEVTVDKLVDGERRVYGWAYYTDEAIYGIACEILLREEKKLKPLVLQSFASFKTFARKGSLPGTVTGDEIVIRGATADSKVERSEEDLRKERDAAFDRLVGKTKQNLPKDWILLESRNFTAVSHTDAKYTKDVLNHAEALRAWLGKNLDYVGSGYAGKILIRICADSEEHTSYQNSRGWFGDAPEVVTFRDKSGWSDWAMESLNRAIFDRWMRDRNEELLWSAPQWFRSGLSSFIEGARSKSGAIEFRVGDWESMEIKETRRKNELIKARAFFSMTGDELWGGNHYRGHEPLYFVRFLVTGSASRSPKYKSVFSDYIKNLIFVLDEMDAKQPTGPDKPPENEEEEAAQQRRRAERWKTEERNLLDRLVEKTFPGWTDADWAAFHAAYERDLK
jgi:hypothetical protein